MMLISPGLYSIAGVIGKITGTHVQSTVFMLSGLIHTLSHLLVPLIRPASNELVHGVKLGIKCGEESVWTASCYGSE